MSGNYSQLYVGPVDFRIPSSAPSNLDISTRLALEEVYQSLQIMARTMINYSGIGPQVPMAWESFAGKTSTILSANLRRFYARAAEDISLYQIISVYDDAGELKIRLADASDNTRVAVGYCNTASGILTGNVGEVILNSGVPLFAGLTIGTHYWLSTTPGAISTTPATAAGNVEQYLGVALSTTELNFTANSYIQH